MALLKCTNYNQEPGLNFKRYQMLGTLPPKPKKAKYKPNPICDWCWRPVVKEHTKCSQQKLMCGY